MKIKGKLRIYRKIGNRWAVHIQDENQSIAKMVNGNFDEQVARAKYIIAKYNEYDSLKAKADVCDELKSISFTLSEAVEDLYIASEKLADGVFNETFDGNFCKIQDAIKVGKIAYAKYKTLKQALAKAERIE